MVFISGFSAFCEKIGLYHIIRDVDDTNFNESDAVIPLKLMDVVQPIFQEVCERVFPSHDYSSDFLHLVQFYSLRRRDDTAIATRCQPHAEGLVGLWVATLFSNDFYCPLAMKHFKDDHIKPPLSTSFQSCSSMAEEAEVTGGLENTDKKND